MSSKRISRSAAQISLAAALLLVIGCGEKGVVAPLSAPVGEASQSKVDICHITGNGSYQRISVAESSLPAHAAHPDGKPGEVIPNSDGSVFGASCEPLKRSDLSITKSDGIAVATSGNQTTYTVRVTNLGPTTAVGAVLSDPAVAGLSKVSVACSMTPGQCAAAPTVAQLESGVALPALASGQFYEVLVTATVTATSGSVTNTATIAAPAGTTDPNAANNSAADTDAVVLPAADLSITKDDGISSLTTLDQMTYTVRVTNLGPGSVSGATLTDAAGGGVAKLSVSCSPTPGQCTTAPTIAELESGFALPSLANGEFYEVQIVAKPTTVPSVTNTATVTAPAGIVDPDLGNNSASDTDQVRVRAVILGVTKTDGVTTVLSGQQTTYTVRVTNNGPDDLIAGVRLRDPVVAGLHLVSASCSTTPGQCTSAPTIAELEVSGVILPALANGQFYEIQITATVTAISGTVTNRIVMSALPVGYTGSPGGAMDTDGVIQPTADLSITKGNGVSSVSVGALTTYTITVINHGPGVADGATVLDPASTGLTKQSVTCSSTMGAACPTVLTTSAMETGAGLVIPTLPPGGTVSFHVTAHVDAASGSVTNVASVAPPAGITDSNNANNTATDTDPITSANLLVTMTNGVTQVPANGTTTYTILVQNAGPNSADGATVRDVATAGLTLTAVTCSPGFGATCPAVLSVAALQGGGLGIPTLALGGSVTFTVTAAVAASGTAANAAFVATPPGTIDPNLANNSASDQDQINTPADVSITVTDVSNIRIPGATLKYKVVVTNHGPGAATGTLLQAFGSPASFFVVPVAKCADGSCTLAGDLGFGGATIPSLPSGSSIVLTIVASATELGSVSLTVGVANAPDLDLSNNTASVTTVIADH